MSALSLRFKEERKRLRLTQKVLAEHIGVSLNSIINWENGYASPSAEAVASTAGHGADVLYILTGKRNPNASAPTDLAAAEDATDIGEKRLLASAHTRICEERCLLGLTVEQFAALCQVSTHQQRGYETGMRVPDLDYLQAAWLAEADVFYIVTGQRSATNCTKP